MGNNPKRADFRCLGEHVEILLYDTIDSRNGIGAQGFAEDLRDAGDVKRISLRVNSPGGDVFEGLTIYNTLIRHSAEVIVDIDGMALSIASVIALSGDVVRMAENAMFMIHDPWSRFEGSSDEFRDQADLMDKIKSSLVDTYVARTDLSPGRVSEMMSDETWMSASEALSEGFVHEETSSMKIAACSDRKSKSSPSWIKNVPSWKRHRMSSDNVVETPPTNRLIKSKQKLALTLASMD